MPDCDEEEDESWRFFAMLFVLQSPLLGKD